MTKLEYTVKIKDVDGIIELENGVIGLVECEYRESFNPEDERWQITINEDCERILDAFIEILVKEIE